MNSERVNKIRLHFIFKKICKCLLNNLIQQLLKSKKKLQFIITIRHKLHLNN